MTRQPLQEDFVGENNAIPSSGALGPKFRGSALFAKHFWTLPEDGILYVEQGLVDIVGFAGLQTVEMFKVHQCESK